MHAPTIEILRDDLPRGDYRVAVFDFDGTLSLLRRNWEQVMIPQMLEVLQATDTSESVESLRACVEEFVARLTGRQTIYQMIQLAEEVKKRGGTPLDPLEYKHQYHERLWSQVRHRVAEAQRSEEEAERLTVPGSRELLAALHDAGLTLYLASGTDEHYVKNELAVLGLDQWFEGRVFGAQDDYQSFSKAKLIRRILEQPGLRGDRGDQLRGDQLIGFGDGFVEIEEIRRAGGVAVGVASDEEQRSDINPRKRERLIQAGADLIIPHYLPLAPLLDELQIGA